MVAPVNNSNLVNTLQRPVQAPAVNQTANRQVAQAVLNKTPTPSKVATSQSISLASANTNPPPNLPRGSIVDKLV